MIDPTALLIYDRGESADLALAHWWTIMKRDGDLEVIFSKPNRTLGGMMTYFQNPARQLMLKHDDGGIWFAAWFEPIMHHVVSSLWVRKDYRQRRMGLQAIYDAYDVAFASFGDVLLGLTRRELLRGHQKLGYHVIGKLPKAVDGEPGYLVSLTREWFEAAKHKPKVKPPAVPVLEVS